MPNADVIRTAPKRTSAKGKTYTAAPDTTRRTLPEYRTGDEGLTALGELLTQEQTAVLLGCGASTVYRAVLRGHLPAVKLDGITRIIKDALPLVRVTKQQ